MNGYRTAASQKAVRPMICKSQAQRRSSELVRFKSVIRGHLRQSTPRSIRARRAGKLSGDGAALPTVSLTYLSPRLSHCGCPDALVKVIAGPDEILQIL